LVFNTPLGRGARTDGYFIRTASVEAGVPCVTTMPGMAAAVQAIEEIISGAVTVRPLQDFLAGMTMRATNETSVSSDDASREGR
jgi:carbamoyl-phosphate synthase large subunit